MDLPRLKDGFSDSTVSVGVVKELLSWEDGVEVTTSSFQFLGSETGLFESS